ncbi:DUF1127 domain-containing protein [Ramlibacter sp. AN1133]|uniref:DUF1127 domain-containing protein n=1 Tax=Ramlibacter sp. AN1133 TaxID=3133429 RepID=UPI0030BF318D
MNAVLTRLAAAWQRFTSSLEEARRARRALRELAQMDSYALRDLGISHVALATAARIDGHA